MSASEKEKKQEAKVQLVLDHKARETGANQACAAGAKGARAAGPSSPLRERERAPIWAPKFKWEQLVFCQKRQSR